MMKSKIGIHIGFNFAEIHIPAILSKSTQEENLLIYTAKKNLASQLNEIAEKHFANENSPILISTDWNLKCIKQQLGEEIAFLTTSGFEKWPFLRQPDLRTSFSEKVNKAESLLSPDLSFGISERIDANANIQKNVDEKDLMFLIEKLRLLQTKHIGIGFLNSNKNSFNEEFAQKFFLKNDIKSTISSSFKNAKSEISRWNSTIIDAYCKTYFEQEFKELEEKNPNLKLELYESNNSINLFDKLFLLQKIAQEKKAQLIYLSLEDFYIVDQLKTETEWSSQFGPIYVSQPHHKRCEVQPTSYIPFNRWAVGEISKEEGDFEPGPVIFGRSSKLQLIDILWYLQKLNLNILDNLVHAKAKDRINEVLHTYVKEADEKTNNQDLAQNIFSNSAKKLAKAIYDLSKDSTKSLYICGPLAEVYFSELKKYLSEFQLELEKNSTAPIAKTLSKNSK